MSRYSGNFGPSSNSTTKSPDSFQCTTVKSEKQDDRASQSDSEDGSYALYGDAHKLEDLEDESNTALTSQTLNADGTPKRPMNAFMIFARRRRPQVSAENQAMRTGEISKILSKEWVSMPPSDKQFYLEQAKQLKETFNTRYPDYVYRRRPNNSRKRRRSDAGGSVRPPDQAHGDQDDMAGSVDLEASPTDVDDHLDVSLPSPYSRPSYISPSSVDPSKYGSHSRGLGHQISSESLFRSNGQYSSSLPPAERMGSSLGSTGSPRLSIGHGGMAYPYGQTAGHNPTPPHFGGQSLNSPTGWHPRVDRSNPSWMGGGPDRLPNPISTQKPYSSSWSGSAELPNTPSSASPSSANYFPTLNTPFYPNQPHISPFQSNASTSPNTLQPQNPTFDSLGHIQGNPMARDYNSRNYDPSSISPLSYPASGNRDPLPYSQRHLPPVQTGSIYPEQSLSSGQGQQSPFWPRD
ncbi:Transcription factor Sox-2 [Psilocybe cubensis]|uniref:Transcription factor Sox-2 n=2 Tax=Psilocybe cubensis TaxID=181762 RepID=A0ACB8GK62_PSICU|nr:Transcription factor Sox-2 [Psilocybe cubensis]KAH9475777.1 Transcription factor Sox-2 [Psilocybe cubensis]